MKIILGVTGCIGAYKSASILRLLQKEGFDVTAVMTRAARDFLGPLTLEKLSGHEVLGEPLDGKTGRIEHIALARESDLLLVAPATANILARFARGVADDFLSTLYLSTTTPVVVAPAMNVEMWNHPATRENVSLLRERGVVIVEPEAGYLACGEEGEGRLAEPEAVVGAVLDTLRPARTLANRRVLVTSGPTVEDIDPVRFISNRSSGKMGYALAAEAQARGARVTLISGPTQLEPPAGVTVHAVRSARQMAGAVEEHFGEADVVVMAAAVADFSPRNVSPHKIKKEGAEPVLQLAPTVDILERLGPRRGHRLLIGFAAESENLVENARRKLEKKNLDLVVGNDIALEDSGFQSDFNRVIVMDRAGGVQEWERLSKRELAARLWDRIEQLQPQSAPV